MFSKKPDIKEVKQYIEIFDEIKSELKKVIVGQDNIINSLLKALISDGHVLVEGVPGIAKTLLVRALAEVTGCNFSRVQFTVDLLPTDIIGITTYDKVRGFETVKGPIFANFIIADEINRSSPKTQSALLEAMQEKQVTIGKTTYKLELPFFVMATINPIESAGIYPLPEAQIDRFLFKIIMDYPKVDEEQKILRQNITLKSLSEFNLNPILNQEKIISMQRFTKDIYLSNELEKYIVALVNATRKREKLKLGKYIEYGASPRASIALFIASKADALLDEKNFVTPHNIKNIAHEVLRHRIILNYEGQSEGITTDDIISEILEKIPIP